MWRGKKMTIIMTPSITSCTRGGITIEFSEMRGPNKIFGPFILQNGPNILFGPLITENSIVTPPLIEGYQLVVSPGKSLFLYIFSNK